MPIKNSRNSKSESMSAEAGVLTGVAQKVGSAIGTVVSVLSGTGKASTSKAGPSKKNSFQAPQSRQKKSGRTVKMTTTPASNHSPKEKSPKRRSGNTTNRRRRASAAVLRNKP